MGEYLIPQVVTNLRLPLLSCLVTFRITFALERMCWKTDMREAGLPSARQIKLTQNCRQFHPTNYTTIIKVRIYPALFLLLIKNNLGYYIASLFIFIKSFNDHEIPFPFHSKKILVSLQLDFPHRPLLHHSKKTCHVKILSPLLASLRVFFSFLVNY